MEVPRHKAMERQNRRCVIESEHEDLYPWLCYFLSIVKAQADAALAIIQDDRIEDLLSEKQLAFWQWAQQRNELLVVT